MADDKTTLSQDTLERARSATGPRSTLVIHHHGELKVVPLAEGSALVIGRTYPADVVVDDPSLSRTHARFSRVPEGVRVDDLRSTNGTHLRGARIESAVLRPGEAVTLGAVTVSFNVAETSALLEGVETYERFLAIVDDELVRGRTFRRPLALLMLRAIDDPETAHVSRWLPRVRKTLRPVDRLTLWGRNAALVLLPESDAERARVVADALVSGGALGEASVVCGAAALGSSAGELLDRARTLCRRASASRRVLVEADELGPPASGPIFASPAMRTLGELIERVASSTIPILVSGPTGSGKEVVARALHDASPRRGAPLCAVNCGAIPATLLESQLFGHEKGAFTGAERTAAGLFERAHRGTLFLDEVGELTPAAQAALLRVLETKRLTRVGGSSEIEVDVRVVAATHRDLEAMVEEGSFRQDLLFRLNSLTLPIPPLRERLEDLEALQVRFLEEACRAAGRPTLGIEPAALALLRAYAWPGNVRELRNAIERATIVCMGERIGVEDLPESLRASPAAAGAVETVPVESDVEFKERIKAFETDLILDALRRTDGNQTQAAKLLKMPLRTLVHKLKTHGIKKIFE